MKRLIILIFISLFLGQDVNATGDSTSILKPGDVFLFQNNVEFGSTITHVIEKKQTLFSILRAYRLNEEELVRINPILKVRHLQISDKLNIPFHSKRIQYKVPPQDYDFCAPIYYIVKNKEGLFCISKKTHRSIIELKKLNNLKTDQVNIGQQLLVGWINIFENSELKNTIKPVKKETKIDSKVKSIKYQNENTVKIIEKNKKIKGEIEKSIVEPSPIASHKVMTGKEIFIQKYKNEVKLNSKGIAFWHKDIPTSNGLYVLHRTAAPNSIIAISNPMYNNTVYAKVIGTIPDNVYSSDVMIVISFEVAKQLGAKDERFFSKIAYIIRG